MKNSEVRYALLVQGKGEGCDHTIACNKDFVILKKGTTLEGAIAYSKEYIEERDEEMVESLTLCVVSEVKELDIDEVIEGVEKAEIKKLQQEVIELRKKYGDAKSRCHEISAAITEFAGKDKHLTTRLVDRNSDGFVMAQNILFEAMNKKLHEAKQSASLKG